MAYGCDLACYNPDIDEIEDVISAVLGRRYRFPQQTFWKLIDRFTTEPVGMTMIEGIIMTWEATKRGLFVNLTA